MLNEKSQSLHISVQQRNLESSSSKSLSNIAMIVVKIMARFLRRRRFKHTFFNLYSQERQKTSHGRKTSKNLPSSCHDSCAFAPRPSLQPSFERNRLTVVCRAQIAPGFNTDRIGEEAYGTVGKSRVDPASMPASSGKSERFNR